MTNTTLRIEFIRKFSLLTLTAFYVYGIQFIVYDFIRTANQQHERYQIGRTEPGRIVTNNDGYKKLSNHQRARAKDLVIVKDGKLIWKHIPAYDRLAEIWKSLQGRWGGDWYKEGKTTFDDCYHFEY